MTEKDWCCKIQNKQFSEKNQKKKRVNTTLKTNFGSLKFKNNKFSANNGRELCDREKEEKEENKKTAVNLHK